MEKLKHKKFISLINALVTSIVMTLTLQMSNGQYVENYYYYEERLGKLECRQNNFNAF